MTFTKQDQRELELEVSDFLLNLNASERAEKISEEVSKEIEVMK